MTRPLLVAAFTCIFLVVAAAAVTPAPTSEDADLAELLRRRSKARDAVISFSSDDFARFAASKPPRDYHMIFMLNAKHLQSHAMNLPALRREFTLAAQAFARGDDSKAIFFVELMYEVNKDLFHRLNVKRLPSIFHWAPSAVAREGRSIKLPKSSECGERIKSYPWTAEDIVRCAADLSELSAAAVERPSLLTHPAFPLLLVGGLASGGAAAWRFYNSPLARVNALWAVGALAVYWFSTSGGMYNIIRGVPLVTANREGRMIWWLDGRSGQLGAEGFVMGSSYMLFSALLASLTYVAPRVKSAGARGVLSLVLVIAAALTALRILAAYKNKTGMSMRTFF